MLKAVSFFIVLTTLISSCRESNKTEDNQLQNTTFDVHGRSEFMFINNTSDSLDFSLINWISLPGNRQEFELHIAPFDTFQTDVTSQGFHYFDFYVNDTEFKALSAPNASIVFNYDSDSIYFSTDFDSINTYLKKSSGSHYRNYETTMNLINLTQREDITYQSLIDKNDEIIKNAQLQLIKDRNELPDWYVVLEHKRLSVLGASYKLNCLTYRKRMLGLDDHIPVNYISSITKDVPYLDESLMGFPYLSRFYMDYCWQNFSPFNDTTSNHITEHRTDSLLNSIRTSLPQPFSDYAISLQLSRIIRLAKPQFKIEWANYISDTSFKNLIINEYSVEDVLPKGVELPHFTALTSDSISFDSDQLQDSILLINFWASSCAPCITKFHFENALVEYFNNKPVKIINMCIESDWDMFTYFINKDPLKTFNLFANHKTTKQLILDFGIDALPHSILIDKNGMVITNKYSVNEKTTISYIESLLSNYSCKTDL